jgi:hypothetical protein
MDIALIRRKFAFVRRYYQISKLIEVVCDPRDFGEAEVLGIAFDLAVSGVVPYNRKIALDRLSESFGINATRSPVYAPRFIPSQWLRP